MAHSSATSEPAANQMHTSPTVTASTTRKNTMAISQNIVIVISNGIAFTSNFLKLTRAEHISPVGVPFRLFLPFLS